MKVTSFGNMLDRIPTYTPISWDSNDAYFVGGFNASPPNLDQFGKYLSLRMSDDSLYPKTGHAPYL
jgi:hypothetical protein